MCAAPHPLLHRAMLIALRRFRLTKHGSLRKTKPANRARGWALLCESGLLFIRGYQFQPVPFSAICFRTIHCKYSLASKRRRLTRIHHANDEARSVGFLNAAMFGRKVFSGTARIKKSRCWQPCCNCSPCICNSLRTCSIVPSCYRAAGSWPIVVNPRDARNEEPASLTSSLRAPLITTISDDPARHEKWTKPNRAIVDPVSQCDWQ